MSWCCLSSYTGPCVSQAAGCSGRGADIIRSAAWETVTHGTQACWDTTIGATWPQSRHGAWNTAHRSSWADQSMVVPSAGMGRRSGETGSGARAECGDRVERADIGESIR